MSKRIVVIDKSTEYGMDEWWCMWYKCPKCKKPHICYNFKYCPECGIKLEWGIDFGDKE